MSETQDIEQVLKMIKTTSLVEKEKIDWIEKRAMSMTQLYSLSVQFFKEYKLVKVGDSIRFYFPLKSFQSLLDVTDELKAAFHHFEQIGKNVLDFIIKSDKETYYEQSLCLDLVWQFHNPSTEIKFAQSFFAIDYVKSGIITPPLNQMTKDDLMKCARVIQSYNLYYSSPYIDFNHIYCTQVKTEIDYLVEHGLFEKENYFFEFTQVRVE